MAVPFEIVGIFGTRAGGGSPLAVVHDADDLDTTEMQWIAGRMRVDETVFVLKPTVPEATYRVRVFTPRAESPYGGHSAVGTAVSMVRSGRVSAGEVVQQCGGKLLRLRADADRAVVTATGPQPLQSLPAGPVLDTVGLTKEDLDGEPVLAGFGPLFRLVPVRAEALAAARPDFAAMDRAGLPEVFLFAWDEARRIVTARLFAPGWAIPEDPACGSVALALGAWLGSRTPAGTARTFRIEQGREMQRPALLECTVAVGDDGALTATTGGEAPVELTGEITGGPLSAR
ncbi:MAG TPA: PhzF family phenazine biosynthesis protein [Actinoplanes sp.]|jgi:trans-2,3-dihydro-3-hydroxyanthranilate isomerase